MTNSGLKKAELFNIDSNRPATTKQLYAVAKHFATIHDSGSVWKFSKVFGAILIKFQTEHVETPITMGDVNNFLNLKKIPVKFVKSINTSKKQPKVVKKAAVKTSKEVSATTPSKKASDMTVEEFKAKLAGLAARVETVESEIQETRKDIKNIKSTFATFEAKLDILMAWLETDPEAL